MEEGKELVKINEGELEKVPERDQPPIPISNVQAKMEELIPYAGTIEINEEQKKLLFAPVDPETVEIRPDGLIYLPWMEYVQRLRDAFGIGWAIIPRDMPKLQQNHMYWPFYLMIQGKLAGFSIGEQEYQPSNRRMTYSDATEGAKSNALMRLCKGIGISLELWKPSFVREWKRKYAEEYWDKEKKENRWRKKGNGGEVESTGTQETTEEKPPIAPAPPPEPKMTYDDYYKRMSEITNQFELKKWWTKHYPGIETLPQDQFSMIVEYKNALKKQFEGEKK